MDRGTRRKRDARGDDHLEHRTGPSTRAFLPCRNMEHLLRNGSPKRNWCHHQHQQRCKHRPRNGACWVCPILPRSCCRQAPCMARRMGQGPTQGDRRVVPRERRMPPFPIFERSRRTLRFSTLSLFPLLLFSSFSFYEHAISFPPLCIDSDSPPKTTVLQQLSGPFPRPTHTPTAALGSGAGPLNPFDPKKFAPSTNRHVCPTGRVRGRRALGGHPARPAGPVARPCRPLGRSARCDPAHVPLAATNHPDVPVPAPCRQPGTPLFLRPPTPARARPAPPARHAQGHRRRRRPPGHGVGRRLRRAGHGAGARGRPGARGPQLWREQERGRGVCLPDWSALPCTLRLGALTISQAWLATQSRSRTPRILVKFWF